MSTIYTILSKDYKYTYKLQTPGIISSDFQAHPTYIENNIFKWYFVIFGPTDTIYSQGQYFGKIIFPDYDNSEQCDCNPIIMMFTPNGRIDRVCWDIWDVKGKFWEPKLGIQFLIKGLMDFMMFTERNDPDWEVSDDDIKTLAKDSKRANITMLEFEQEFPELFEQNREEIRLNDGIDGMLPLADNQHIIRVLEGRDKKYKKIIRRLTFGNSNDINIRNQKFRSNKKISLRGRLHNIVSKLRKANAKFSMKSYECSRSSSIAGDTNRTDSVDTMVVPESDHINVKDHKDKGKTYKFKKLLLL